jgi:hypothetical protein
VAVGLHNVAVVVSMSVEAPSQSSTAKCTPTKLIKAAVSMSMVEAPSQSAVSMSMVEALSQSRTAKCIPTKLKIEAAVSLSMASMSRQSR